MAISKNLETLQGTLLHKHFLNKREKQIHSGLLRLSSDLSRGNLDLETQAKELRLKCDEQSKILGQRNQKSEDTFQLKQKVEILQNENGRLKKRLKKSNFLLRCSQFKEKMKDLKKKRAEKEKINFLKEEIKQKDLRLRENLQNMKLLTGENNGQEKETGNKLISLVETIKAELLNLKSQKD